MRKIYIRILPFAVLSYVLSYIDRINVSFAGLTMQSELGMSAAAFGFAAGTFEGPAPSGPTPLLV
jgi:ACS family tartrate transporter-like MFS transporter